MEIDKIEVGYRLKDWLNKEFGSVAEACRQLDLSEVSVRTSYLNGQSLPGALIIGKLIEHNCNIPWLLFGEQIKEGDVRKTQAEYKVERLQKVNSDLADDLEVIVNQIQKVISILRK
jgi:hypothetical protein